MIWRATLWYDIGSEAVAVEAAGTKMASQDGGPDPVPDVTADSVLDTVGLFCPVPIIRTAERIRRMQAGELLEVLSDDKVILIDLPAWCRSTGHAYLGSRRLGSEIHLFVKKGGAR